MRNSGTARILGEFPIIEPSVTADSEDNIMADHAN
jgi:hypothetical protein